MECKPYVLPFPAVPGIVRGRKGCVENRGSALTPLGKVCLEFYPRPGRWHGHDEFFGGLSAYVDVFIHP